MKLIAPPPAPHRTEAALVFLLSYGGGLVGGDQVSLRVDVERDARLAIVTQGHTKIFRPTAASQQQQTTRQSLEVHVARGAALCLLPDPVQPFADSRYEQTQVFRVARGGNLCVLDWVTQGRTARGEDWSLDLWRGRNEVWAVTRSGRDSKRERDGDAPGTDASEDEQVEDEEERLLVRDTVILDRAAASIAQQSHAGTGGASILRETMHGLGVFGTLILRGPLLRDLGAFFLSEFANLPRLGARDFRTPEVRDREEAEAKGGRSALDKWREDRLARERRDGVLWSAAPVRGCIVIKFGAPTVEAARVWLGDMLVRQGDVGRLFGEDALMCVR